MSAKKGTELPNPPVGIVLSEKNKEILVAARALEEVLIKHGSTIAMFGAGFYGMGEHWGADAEVCRIQKHEDKDGALKSALELLTPEQKKILSDYFFLNPYKP